MARIETEREQLIAVLRALIPGSGQGDSLGQLIERAESHIREVVQRKDRTVT